MRILLRSTQRASYFLTGDTWTEDRNLAQTFRTSFDAMELVQTMGLEDMEVVLSFDRADMDLRIAAENLKPKRPSSPEEPLRQAPF